MGIEGVERKKRAVMEEIGKKTYKFPLTIQVTSCAGSKSETDPPMHRNKGAEITPGPFHTPDSYRRSTGVSVVLFIYTHISNLQREGGCAHQCSLRGFYGNPGPSQEWKISVAVWKTGFNVG